MNPNAKPYVPPGQTEKTLEQTRGQIHYVHPTAPVIGTLTGWPSFPTRSMPIRGSAGDSATQASPANPQQTPLNLQTERIEPSTAYLGELGSLVHPLKDLAAGGYTLTPLTRGEIEAKKRCGTCGKSIKRGYQRNKSYPGKPQKPQPKNGSGSTPNVDNVTLQSQATPKDTNTRAPTVRPNGHPDADEPPPQDVCFFHPGVADRTKRLWTCCKQPLQEKPCSGAPEHNPTVYLPGQLEQEWQYFYTPTQRTSPAAPHFAVAIDCEMGTALDGETELIRVTVLDYFTGAVLVDRLVYPDNVMSHFNTRYSGVTRLMMETAKRDKTCFMGRKQAREEVWKFVGPQTIVVGHSAHNDLKSMRWIHGRIVDSFMLEPKPVEEMEQEQKEKNTKKDTPTNTSAIQPTGSGQQEKPKTGDQKAEKPKAPKKSGPRALKTLARIKLGREIQNQGKLGHDSHEDALAARDLVHWQVLDRRRRFATGSVSLI